MLNKVKIGNYDFDFKSWFITITVAAIVVNTVFYFTATELICDTLRSVAAMCEREVDLSQMVYWHAGATAAVYLLPGTSLIPVFLRRMRGF